METSLLPRLSAEKLALAQSAFREFHAHCFWFMRPDAKIVAEEVPYICERLRADGERRGFFIAADLCRQAIRYVLSRSLVVKKIR